MGALLLFVCLLAPFVLACAIRGRRARRQASSKSLALPPGSMGWPYVGETFQLYSSKNPNVFFARKQNRHGPIFKTHILGCPCVMVSSPEAARFVLVTQAHLFKPTFPASKERMLGPQAIFFQQGDYHTPTSAASSSPRLLPEAIRAPPALPRPSRPSRCGASSYALNVALLSIFGEEEMRYIEELKQCYLTLEKGYNSMPVNLPGTLFHKAMKARKRLGAIVAHIISARRERQRGSDLLASFLDDREALTDAQIADNVIGVIFAARDTTASVLTWMVKFLGDHPSVLKAVIDEQQEIARSKGSSGEPLTWADTRRMRMTSRVIQETMRVASILSFTFREAVEDVEYQGYLIPKGWKVLPLFRNIHHSPDHFPCPEKFDPSRFEVAPKPNTFMPFGNGTHSCPGNELAKLEMLVLFHHLATKYRWSTSKSESGVQFGPFALPLNGLPMTFTRKHDY
ncbi:hypothetical protein PR202_gb09489 [Eleusine coracana subsp. coracana]|uniref:Abscisic acid 8'-hydroxylase 1 n=1 Tax=Eleusine coracana subsp. coracana TaxID=191504 RepID=A0AAV5EH51_ELECO|nr:hypothetical protein PR202_gb09489 [Eleusine coracana subsp. coracana]